MLYNPLADEYTLQIQLKEEIHVTVFSSIPRHSLIAQFLVHILPSDYRNFLANPLRLQETASGPSDFAQGFEVEEVSFLDGRELQEPSFSGKDQIPVECGSFRKSCYNESYTVQQLKITLFLTEEASISATPSQP